MKRLFFILLILAAICSAQESAGVDSSKKTITNNPSNVQITWNKYQIPARFDFRFTGLYLRLNNDLLLTGKDEHNFSLHSGLRWNFLKLNVEYSYYPRQQKGMVRLGIGYRLY